MDTSLLKITQPEDEICEKVYRGIRIGWGEKNRGICNVDVDEKPLSDYVTGDNRPYYEWGCQAFGSKRLAMDILHDLFVESYWTTENRLALQHDIIEKLPFEGWEMKENVLLGWMDVLEQKRVNEDHKATMELIEKSKSTK